MCDVLFTKMAYKKVLIKKTLYKVVSFLSIAKDLANGWNGMVLLYSKGSYRSWDGFYFYKKSR